MTWNRWIEKVRWGVPAVPVGVLLGVLWGMSACGYFGQEMPRVFVGWLSVMFLAATVGGIVLGGTGRCGNGAVAVRFAVLVGVCCGMFLLIDWSRGFIGLGECFAVIVVFVAWTGLWTVGTWAAGRFFERAAVGIGMLLAMLSFAAPVTGMPLVRAVSGEAQAGVVTVMGYGTPMLGVLDGIKGSVQVGGGGATGWTELPEMYHLTGFGQDVAAPSPRWWMSSGIYAVAGVAAWGVGMFGGRRQSRLLDRALEGNS